MDVGGGTGQWCKMAWWRWRRTTRWHRCWAVVQDGAVAVQDDVVVAELVVAQEDAAAARGEAAQDGGKR
jgi:hypothetical protein